MLVPQVPRSPRDGKEETGEERGRTAVAPPSLSRRGEDHDADKQSAQEEDGNGDHGLHEMSLFWKCFHVTRFHGSVAMRTCSWSQGFRISAPIHTGS
jgi:hypothetical protein